MNEGEQKVRHEHEMSLPKKSLQIIAENGPFEPFSNLFHLPQKEAFLITVTSVTQFFVLKSKKFFGISGHLLLLLFRDFLKGR